MTEYDVLKMSDEEYLNYCKKNCIREKRRNIMSKYEVWVIVWSDEFSRQIKKVAGEFDSYMNASIFAKAYREHYSATAEIVEYIRK